MTSGSQSRNILQEGKNLCILCGNFKNLPTGTINLEKHSVIEGHGMECISVINLWRNKKCPRPMLKVLNQGVGDSTKRGKTSLKTQAFATKSERLPQNDPFATKMTRLPQNRGVFPSFPRFPTFCQLLIGLSRVTWSRGGGRPILKLPRALVGVGKGVRTRRKNG